MKKRSKCKVCNSSGTIKTANNFHGHITYPLDHHIVGTIGAGKKVPCMHCKADKY